MSGREAEGSLDSGNVCNVVQLQPVGAARSHTTIAREALAPDPASIQPDSLTRDGLDLLKAFFAIDDAAARAALVVLAQRLAEQSPKR
jgi:hypothetical protein